MKAKFRDEELIHLTDKINGLEKQNRRLRRKVSRKVFDDDYADSMKTRKELMLKNLMTYLNMSIIISQMKKDHMKVPVTYHRENCSELIKKNRYKFKAGVL